MPPLLKRAAILLPVIAVFLLAALVLVRHHSHTGPWLKPEPGRFTVRTSFRFPSPHFLLPEHQILQAEWIGELKRFLLSQRDNTVVMVTCSMSYVDLLLNWLVALQRNTNIPPTEVLVVSVDEELHAMLKQRALSSVLIKSETMMRSNISYRSHNTPFVHIRVMRLALWRLLNHWGYNVINVDVDAVPLRDLRELFASYPEADMVAQQGFPGWRYKDFGATMCTGAVLYRSSIAMERLWQVARDVDKATESDQQHVNNAMVAMEIKWYTRMNCTDPYYCHVYGLGMEPHHINITLVPQTILCRRGCDPSLRKQLYLWHYVAPNNSKKKTQWVKYGDSWFLKKNWRKVSRQCTNAKGSEWLELLTVDS